MQRLAPWSLVAAMSIAWPYGASAQTTSGTTQAFTSPLVVKKNDEQLKNESTVYGTADDCANPDGTIYNFSATYSTTAPVVEAWVGQSGTDCSTAANRTHSTSSSNPPCKLVGSITDATSKPSIDVSAGKLFSIEWDKDTCDEASGQTYTLYFIPLNTATNLSGNTASDPINVGSGVSTLRAVFTLYTKRPAAPTGVEAQTGESKLGIKFTTIAGAPTKTKYRAFFDWGAGGQECGSGALVKGEAPPEESETLSTVTITSGSASLKGLDSKGIAINDLVAAAVVTVDPSGNQSLVSDVVCVERVNTQGFLDSCAKDPDCNGGFESCSALRGRGARGTWTLGLLLMVVGIAFVIRRRHV